MNATVIAFPGAAQPALSAPPVSAVVPVAAQFEARLALDFNDDNGVTRLTGRAHFGPLRVQKALYPEAPAVCHAVIIHPPGGVVGGDSLQIRATVGANAAALVTTPGAAKWYKANGRISRQQVILEAAANATLEWLPQETIFFNHADVALEQRVDLAADASYIGSEILCFGRTASGERFDSGRIAQHTSIRRGGKLLWWEQGVLEVGGHGGTGTDSGIDGMHSPLGLGGYTVCATVIAVGKVLPTGFTGSLRQVAAAATASEATDPNAKIGVTQMKSLLVARYLGHSSDNARHWMRHCWQHIRPALLDRPAVPPRIWAT